MKRFLGVLFIALAAVFVPSCNIDEEFSSGAPVPLKVFEYTPAPGQFINDLVASGFDGTQTSTERAVEYAQNRLNSELYVSLGGFGGYIVVGFDHDVVNRYQQYDFEILCNAFDGSSEPGIVWVMQDKNQNGVPDDTWYELAGSESNKEETIRNYAVTYHRPTEPKSAIHWSDNQGQSGEIRYLGGRHFGDSYFPQWIEGDSYTLVGTRLQARNYNDGVNWINPNYDWGYADNEGTEDFSAERKSNAFDISNAIDAEGNSVALEYINFVKVQSALNTVSGSLGEVSTEVCGFYDYRL